MSMPDLYRAIEAQALADHLQRLMRVLGQIDTHKRFSSGDNFEEILAREVDRLAESGVTNPYHQACLLLCFFQSGMRWKFPETMSSAADVMHQCFRQALACGASRADYETLHESFAGLNRFNLPWVSTWEEPHFLELFLVSNTAPRRLEMECGSEGVSFRDSSCQLNRDVTHARMSAESSQKTIENDGLESLFKSWCEPFLFHSHLKISMKPILACFETGVQSEGVFVPCQAIEVFDARQLKVSKQPQHLKVHHQDLEAVRDAWKKAVGAGDSQVDASPGPISVEVGIQAGWKKQGRNSIFELQGQVSIELPVPMVQFQATFMHEASLVQLIIQPELPARIHWPVHAQFQEGRLPSGDPLFSCHEKLPLQARLVPVIQLGKPLLQLASDRVGDLLLDLQGRISPQTRCLEVVLTLAHSNLSVDWLAVDPLLGWTGSQLHLLPESVVSAWSLLDG